MLVGWFRHLLSFAQAGSFPCPRKWDTSSGPGRPGWSPTQVPTEIRTCTSNASGSSRRGTVPHTIHRLAVTRWEVRCPRRGSDVPVHNAAPPSLRGVRAGGSPASSVLWGAPTPCRPSRRTSFPSLGDTIVSSLVRPRRPRTWAADQPGVGKPGLRPALTMETARSPRFPGNPFGHSPCSPTPV